MKKKNKIILLIIIFIIIIFLILLTVYKYINKKDEVNDSFKVIDIGLSTLTEDINYKEEYEKNIIKSTPNSYEYKIGNSLNGRIYIDNNKKIHLTDDNNNINNILSEEKFNAIYKKSRENDVSKIVIYAITEKGKLYKIALYESNINNVIITLMLKDQIITNFTTLENNLFLGIDYENIVVLTDDGIMYNANTGLPYIDDTLSIYDEYYIYTDGIISYKDKILRNNNGELYKIKYIIDLKEKTGIFEKADILFITEDNKIIYIDDKIYEYKTQIKNITKKEKADGNTYKILFDNNESINVIGFEDFDYYKIDS